LENLVKLRETLKALQDKLGAIKKGPLSDCFGMLFNDSTWTLEALSHYYDVWNRPTAGIPNDEIELSRGENGERVREVTKWLFVSVISHIEFAIRQYTRSEAAFKRLYARKEPVSLRKMIGKSATLSPPLTDRKLLDQWNCLLDIRNTVVHNNGIADRDAVQDVAGMPVHFKANTMMRGDLRFFPHLTTSAIDLFASWAEKALRA